MQQVQISLQMTYYPSSSVLCLPYVILVMVAARAMQKLLLHGCTITAYSMIAVMHFDVKCRLDINYLDILDKVPLEAAKQDFPLSRLQAIKHGRDRSLEVSSRKQDQLLHGIIQAALKVARQRCLPNGLRAQSTRASPSG